MNSKKKAFLNLIYSAIGQILTIAIGLVIPRLFIVGFGSAINGLINSVNQFLVYLSLFEAGVGAATLQALYKPVALDDKEDINSILAATDRYYKKTGLFYLIGLIIFSIAYSVFVESELGAASVFLLVLFSGLPNVILFYFQGKYYLLLRAEGKQYIQTNLITIITVATGLAKIMLLYLGLPVLAIIFVGMLISLIQALYIMVYIRRRYKWINLRCVANTNALSQKNFALVHQLSFLIFNNTDVLILTFFCDLKIVSVYSIYKMITSHIEKVLSIFNNSVDFALGQQFQTDLIGYKKKIDVFESYYSIFMYSAFSVALYLFIPFMKLYTDGISDINYVDRNIAVLFVINSILSQARVPMLNTINYAGHFKLTMPQSIVESIINLTVSLVGVHFLGIYGVLLGTAGALLYRTNDVIIYTNKKILQRSPLKTYLIHIINTVILLSLQCVYSVFFTAIHNYFVFAIYGCIMVLIAISVFLTVHIIIFKDVREVVINLILLKFLRRR